MKSLPRRRRSPLTLWACALASVFPPSAPAQQAGVEILPIVVPPRVAPLEDPPVVAPPVGKVLPITLDTVLRLANDQNGQIRLARERVQEAFAKQDLTGKNWLPDLTAGPSFYRHEGGIQDFQGNLVRSSYGSLFAGVELRGKWDLRDATFQRIQAERQVLQRQGELSKLASEQLLDAASTYIDLVSARSAAALGKQASKQLADLLQQTNGLYKVDPGLRIEVVRIEAELGACEVLTRKLNEGARSASLKLLYLMQIDSQWELVIVDPVLPMFQLVDANVDPRKMVDQALRNGPGIRELEALVNRVSAARMHEKQWDHYLPRVEVSLADGGFGAGPGARMAWDNRFDAGVHLRWNLTEWLTHKDRARINDSQVQQAQLSFQDLQARLTLGVQEALESMQSSQDQIALATRHLKYAEESYQLSESRFRQNIKGRSPSEVLLAVRSLQAARLTYLHAIRDYDKAQIRLFVLGGAWERRPPAP